jgi:hypothetical protein
MHQPVGVTPGDRAAGLAPAIQWVGEVAPRCCRWQPQMGQVSVPSASRDI